MALLAVLEDLLRVMVMIVAPLTVAAAFVECYVTPVIMALEFVSVLHQSDICFVIFLRERTALYRNSAMITGVT